MKHTHIRRNLRFRKSPLAALLATALLPASALALELSQSPPGTQSSYVAPNVIMSLDDSGSMNGNDMWVGGRRKTRVQVLKDAVQEVFNDKDLLPDGKIRLAWQTMGNCNNAGSRLVANSTGRNAMRVLDAHHRNNFLNDMRKLGTCAWTPTHGVMQSADAYMRNSSLSVNSPWASVPGKTGAPFLGCRRNYHILLTDGGWNRELAQTSPANFDGTSRTLPDGVQYSTTSDQTHIYRDTDSYNLRDYASGWGTGYTTVADWAFKSWADPLKPLSAFDKGIGPVPDAAYRNAPATETFTNLINKAQPALPKTATLEKYWNPRYNPATWVHMSTFTIGFSNDAVPGSRWLDKPSEKTPYGYDGSFANLANGSETWDASWDKGQDMWHAAINGRGQFYAVEKGDDLAKAFREIVKTINVEAEPARSGFAMSSTNIRRFPAGVFISGYEPQEAWRGWISGHIMQPGGTLEQNPGWDGKTTADRLDAMPFSTRRVWSWNGAGIEFKFDSLGTDQRNHFLDAEPAPSGRALTAQEKQKISDRIDYIKGARGKEGTGANMLRPRHSIQGDIVNSNIWYVDAPASDLPFAGYAEFYAAQKDRQPMIYAGGNDGMLHGFSATDGREKLAYVPNGVLPTLRELTKPDYDDHHRAYVDGPVMTGDVDMAAAAATTRDWRTVLVGALGAGGKGYYVLDVTNPLGFGAGNVLLDKTMPASANSGDIGHIFGVPTLDEGNTRKATQIARLNNNRWAAIMGNGYNSENRRPVLLIQYLDGARELKTLVAKEQVPGEDNGLAVPTPVDLNGDGKPDVVYAGDNMGNLWKFMIADASDSSWGVAFGGAPLFDARAGNPHAGAHPIAAAPAVRRTADAPGLMVAFGTGSNVTTTDANDLTVQSVYAITDRTYYSLRAAHIQVCANNSQPGCAHMPDGQSADEAGNRKRADLVEQKFGSTTTSHNGLTYWPLETRAVDYTQKSGWYLDLTGRETGDTGERLLKPITFGGSQTLDILTEIPAKGANAGDGPAQESCEGISPQSQRQFLTRMNLAQPSKPRLTNWPEDAVELGAGLRARVRDVDAEGNSITRWPSIRDGGGASSGGAATGEPSPDPDEPRPARPAWWQLQ